MVVDTAVLERTSEDQPAPTVSAKARLKEWIRGKVESPDDLKAPAIADLALKEYEDQIEFLAQIGLLALPAFVYDLVLEVISETHDPLDDASLVRITSGVDALEGGQSYIAPSKSTETRAALKNRLSFLKRRYSHWKEHVKDHHMSLLKMTVEDLQQAEAEHRLAAYGRSRRADFVYALRSWMKPDETVGKHYTPEQIYDLEQITIHGKADHYGHLRRASQPVYDLLGLPPVQGQDHGRDAEGPEAGDGLAEGQDGGG